MRGYSTYEKEEEQLSVKQEGVVDQVEEEDAAAEADIKKFFEYSCWLLCFGFTFFCFRTKKGDTDTRDGC